jgi:hypothetical protein
MTALSKNWDPPFTGIWSIPHFGCLAYRDLFPSCRRSAVHRSNILDWLQKKRDGEPHQQSAGRWYLFSIHQFRGVYHLVRCLHLHL